MGCCPFYGGGSVVVDFLFIVTPIVGVCNCSMFSCTLLYVHFSIAIILMGKRELIALLNLSSWCLVMVERLFLTVPRGCLQFVIVVFPDHTHLLFLVYYIIHNTYKTNDRRRTTILISDIYNDILHNVKEENSFGGCLANYICIVLVTMLTHFQSIFLNI